jgi:hypothetical protein
MLRDISTMCLQDDAGARLAVQTRILDRWPDSSVRWLLLDWQSTRPAGEGYRVSLGRTTQAAPPGPQQLRVSCQDDLIALDTGAARFQFRSGTHRELLSADSADQILCTFLTIQDNQGRSHTPHITELEIEESGPLRAVVRMGGYLADIKHDPFINFSARLHFYAGSATVRFVLTMRNPRRAEHPGGLWDLGDRGSIYFKDASLTLQLPPNPAKSVLRFSAETTATVETCEPPFEIYQDSSGGPNWRSTNHVNRNRVVPNSFCGYRVRAAGKELFGKRATPLVTLTQGDYTVSVTVPRFWQNFPKALEVSGSSLTLRLFPGQYGDVHEIQAGEQKTHEFYLAFGRDRVTTEPLAWARNPLHPHATPEWYCASGVVPYLVPRTSDPNAGYLKLVDAAIEGEDTFEHKREVIDEYGWRHFGEIYGDHEAVFHKGPDPLVSHYNNQYDAIAGFAYQFLRSGDPRWFGHFDELASHVIDIDIYHTDFDKAAYNHGLFWHTYHYVDADTGAHRSYPRAAGVCGGGPSNEHNYTTGLKLHYFLTGEAASREAALGLARWVVDMDDGDRTVFRWLARGPTGFASSSRTPTYHGPGRGIANSVIALLDGHQLTDNALFLGKAEELIRRCIHPADNIAARNLLDAENRWFYVMFLQALGRYLDYKVETGRLDFMYYYARGSLLHYADWMANHESPWLERADMLEHPTETWAAQEMRKSDVFKYAAKYANNSDRCRFLERSDYYFRYAISKLAEMKTRTLARPVVLLLSFGYMQAWFQLHPQIPAPPQQVYHEAFGQPQEFVPQKVRALRRLKLLLGAMSIAVIATLVYVVTR